MRIKPFSIRDILLLTVGALTFMITLLVIRDIISEWQRLERIRSLKEAMVMSDELFDATEKLSIERDIAYTILHAPDTATANGLRTRLKESRQAVDVAFSIAMDTLKHYDFLEIATLRGKIETQLSTVRALCHEIDQTEALPIEQRRQELSDRWIDTSTAVGKEVQDLWMEFLKHYTDIDPIVTQHLRYKHLLRIIMDYSGRERAIIGRLIVENAEPTPQEYAQLLHGQGIIDISWQNSGIIAKQSGLYTSIGAVYTDAMSHYLNLHDMLRDIFYVLPGNRKIVSYPISVDLWFELSEQAADSLNMLKDSSLKETRSYVEKLEAQAYREITFNTAFLLIALAMCFYSFRVITSRVIRPINAMVTALLDAIQGKPVSLPTIANTEDEIGKLAQVLHAFQENVEKIRDTSLKLESHARALERSNRELDDFAYIASHDLKEPLRGLFNHSTFLLEDYKDKLDEDGVRKLHRLAYLSQRMERLVNDLLYFSRLGRQELAIQSTDMNEVIHDIENTLEIFLEERHAHITIPKSLPVMTCDKVRITEVFHNLITNAVKYNDKPEKTVEIGFLETGSSPDGTEMKNVFYVKDDGRGIPSQFYEEIFRIFKRLQNTKGEKEEGTGVGLTFVKKIIDRHGGKVWPKSEVGKGTIFYFTLGM